jgi:hypothetical protein
MSNSKNEYLCFVIWILWAIYENRGVIGGWYKGFCCVFCGSLDYFGMFGNCWY